jgi:hypothetical protein
MVKSIGGHHRWASPSAFISAISDIRHLISDIDISYSNIGTKYVRLSPLTPISEKFRYRHQLPMLALRVIILCTNGLVSSTQRLQGRGEIL